MKIVRPDIVTDDTTAIISVPFGTVVSYAGNVPPDGWLLCDGHAISQQEYPNLYGLVGGNVPDLRSRFVVGSGQGSGLSNRPLFSTGGEETHLLSSEEMPVHSHGFYVGGGNGFSGSGQGTDEGYSTNNGSFTESTFNAGGGNAHNNLPPFFALTYIIKY